MKDLKTSVRLLKVGRDYHKWEIITKDAGTIMLLTISDLHLFKALKVHGDLISVTIKNPNLTFLNPHFYRTIIVPMVLESNEVIEAQKSDVNTHQILDNVLLGRREVK